MPELLRLLIKAVSFTDTLIIVDMANGDKYTRNVSDFPNLSKGNQNQLNNYIIEGGGRWLHWEDLDEDLSAEGFLNKK